jgi:NTP pyrophosphatase (non-canonical NTP hydrolase)
MVFITGEEADEVTQLALTLVGKHGVDRYPTKELGVLKLQEELGEITRHVLRETDFSEELADLEICLRMVAFHEGVDLNQAVRNKVAKDDRKFI